MTISLNGNIVRLAGNCGVEEVDTLIGYLERQPEPIVNLHEATAIHTALWQALMVFRPKIEDTPMSSLVAATLLSALRAHDAAKES